MSDFRTNPRPPSCRAERASSPLPDKEAILREKPVGKSRYFCFYLSNWRKPAPFSCLFQLLVPTVLTSQHVTVSELPGKREGQFQYQCSVVLIGTWQQQLGLSPQEATVYVQGYGHDYFRRLDDQAGG